MRNWRHPLPFLNIQLTVSVVYNHSREGRYAFKKNYLVLLLFMRLLCQRNQFRIFPMLLRKVI